MNKIISYISAGVTFIIGMIGMYFAVKKKGANEEKQKNIEQTLKVVNEVKKQTNVVDNMSTSSVRDSLREFTRD
ncbi:MAG: hypothetical protein WC495_03720 [Patescibacteria group bacterium]|jgi:hypothetical protein